MQENLGFEWNFLDLTLGLTPAPLIFLVFLQIYFRFHISEFECRPMNC